MVYPDATVSYTYDAAYNRTGERAVDNTTSAVLTDKGYGYNARNQLTQVTNNQDAAQNVTYQFDANGNQTLKSQNGTITTFVYDVRDKLIAVRQDATTLGQFRYDHAGMRIKKTTQEGEVRYSYDGDSVLAQYDQTGQTLAKYEYGPDQLLSLNHQAEGRQYYHFDALGSVASLTKPDASIQARYQYDAWGNERQSAGNSFNRFGYTGHEKDTETGLYYFKARFYDPDTGRFLTQDAYLGDINTAPSLHRYLYAYSNPTVWVDLDGYESSRVYKDENDIPVGTQYFNGGDGLYYVANGDYAYAGDKYAAWVGDQQANAKIQTKQDPRSWLQRGWDSAKETAANLLDKTKGAVTIAENEQEPGASDAQLTDEQQYERDFGRNSRLAQGAKTIAEGSSAGADAVGEYCSLGCNPASILKGAVVVGGTKALAKHEAKELAGDAAAAAVKAEKAAKVTEAPKSAGRSGKQARLRELANDDKLGSDDRGWIKQEMNSIERGQRKSIRNPPGKDLAHERGREAAKGYGYEDSNLQDRDLHRLQHKYDNFGRKNKERPPQ